MIKIQIKEMNYVFKGKIVIAKLYSQGKTSQIEIVYYSPRVKDLY